MCRLSLTRRFYIVRICINSYCLYSEKTMLLKFMCWSDVTFFVLGMYFSSLLLK